MDGAHVEDGEQRSKRRRGCTCPYLPSPEPELCCSRRWAGPPVFDLIEDCGVSLVDVSSEPFHKDSIRALRFGAKGKLFVSAGDDKLVKIWSAESWHCIATVCSEKRVSAVAMSNDSLHVCFADKFGVVCVVHLPGLEHNEAPVNKKDFSPNGQFIISADCDFEIRVTIFPKKPLDGPHEMQSFCLCHTEFVSCLAFVCTLDYPEGFLVSGSGDSTIRLWDIISGYLLDTCGVAACPSFHFFVKGCTLGFNSFG